MNNLESTGGSPDYVVQNMISESFSDETGSQESDSGESVQ